MEKRKIILKVLMFVVVISIMCLLFHNHPFVLMFISAVQLILLVLFSVKYLNFKFLSAYNIFLCLSYIFHVGQYFLFMFNIDADIPFNISELASIVEMSHSLQFYIFCQNAIFLGVMLSNYYINTKKISSNKYFNTQTKKIYLVIAIILLIIGLPCKAYIDISKFKLYLAGNYLNTYNFQTFGFVSVLSHLFEYGVLMLLRYFQEDKKKSIVLLIFGIVCEIPIILSGNRGWAIIFLLLYFWQYLKNNIKIKFNKKTIFQCLGILIVIHFTLSIITFISDYRSYSISSFSELFNYYVPYITKFALADILGEFGGTMISVIYSMRYIPKFSSYGYGIGYLTSFFTIFPNFGNFLGNLRENMVFVYSFPPEVYSSLGGSYIGELYYNFGYFSIIFAVLIGVVLGLVYRIMNETEDNKTSLLYPIGLCCLANSFWWIRDYFSSIVREIAWFCMLIVLVNMLINGLKGLKKK